MWPQGGCLKSPRYCPVAFHYKMQKETGPQVDIFSHRITFQEYFSLVVPSSFHLDKAIPAYHKSKQYDKKSGGSGAYPSYEK